MLFPHTQALADLIREESDQPMISERGAAADERSSASDPRVLQLILKKKNQQNLLRKMLQDAGYGDLSRMTSFKRESLEDGDD